MAIGASFRAVKPSQEVIICGQKLRVHTSASAEDLERLVAAVTDEVRRVLPPGRPLTMNAILLAALSLAHTVEEERAARVAEAARHGERAALERKTRDVVRRVLVRLDGVLDEELDESDEEAAAGPTERGDR
jgi:cell division protein ZapA